MVKCEKGLNLNFCNGRLKYIMNAGNEDPILTVKKVFYKDIRLWDKL